MSIESQYLEALQISKQHDVQVLLKKSYRGIWETAIKKYSDSAHFVYELLQNADDCHATLVEFDIEENGLWFKHNGTIRFTISDPKNDDNDSENGFLGHINSITSIGNSSKIDEQKIGKFGIGFKAVFAYTATPHIYDDNFNFKLENYIVPNPIEPNTIRRHAGETLFYFPFNHLLKTKTEAYKEIEEKLFTLNQPILFLSNLNRINWVSASKKGSYSKEILSSEPLDNIRKELIQTVCENNNIKEVEQFLLFSQEIKHSTFNSTHRIYIGFKLKDSRILEIGKDKDAFCFFPTKENTKLKFIIQAPFLLTDSREGIKAGDNINESIILILSELAAKSILLLKEIGIKNGDYYLNDSILDLIPYNEAVFDFANRNKVSFHPFYKKIKNIFKTEEILPGSKGKYFSTSKAYWASDLELAELFSDEQISELMANPNSGFVFRSRGQKQLNQANKVLEQYISSITYETLDPKKILRRITANFIENQSDEWILKFYEYLGGRKFLWHDSDKLALKRPILLNQNRKAVTLFEDDFLTPNIFLPSEWETSYDTIYQPFLENEHALAFFKQIEMGQPDLKTEIFKSIIPQYDGDFDFSDEEKLLSSFETFLEYYEKSNSFSRQELIEKLKNISFIASNNLHEPEIRDFNFAINIYFPNQNLKLYFENDIEVYFLDKDFYLEIITSPRNSIFFEFLKDLGCTNYPKIMEINLSGYYETRKKFGLDHLELSETYLNSKTLIDKKIQGFENAIEFLSLEKANLLWIYLTNLVSGLTIYSIDPFFKGLFTYIPKYGKSYKQIRFESSISAVLKNDKWLFDKNGELKSPKELELEDLNDIYEVQSEEAKLLLNYIGIENPEEDLNLSDEQLEAFNLGKKLIANGLKEEDLDEFLKILSARKLINQNIKVENFPAEVTESYQETEEELEINKTFESLKKGIKEKRERNSTKEKIDIENLEPVEKAAIIDRDDFSKPSVDYQKKITKLKLEAESAIEDLSRIEKLNETVDISEKYSFAWFKALLELEYLNSSESNAQGKQISIQFGALEKESGTEKTLILKHPNRYIPQSIEDIGDLQIRIYEGNEIKTLTVEVVSVKEYTLRAKLKKVADISDLKIGEVSRIVIDIKNPVFILEELRKAFFQLNLADEFNMQQNLTENIKFIFGPPGTGKTTFLATNEIIPLMQKEEELKVLVLTPTNKAADVLTNRIIEKMGEDETFFHWLLRFGTTAAANIESSSILVDKSFDLRTKSRNTTITTIARFAYDYFQPDIQGERLHLKFLHWDYIIIDEASMVNLASIAYVLYQQKDANFIIAGDPFQIQPITQIEQWKDENIYSMVQLDKFINPVTIPHNFEIENLQTQYRSIPTIGNVFSHFTYNGILEHNRQLSDQKQLKINGLIFKDINVIKFPVAKFESIYKPNTLNGSHYQIYSALFLVEFVHNLSQQIHQSQYGKYRIGIICPYKSQATLIEKILSQQHIDNDLVDIQIGTIHGFQGDECDIILVIFNPPYSIGRSQNMFLNKQNILNVSISRARDYLFIVMPDDDTQDIENLYKIKKIEKLIQKHAAERHTVYLASEIEEKMFGSSTFVYDNSFATSHQSVNVYSKPEKKYEVRCEEVAIDVQIRV